MMRNPLCFFFFLDRANTHTTSTSLQVPNQNRTATSIKTDFLAILSSGNANVLILFTRVKKKKAALATRSMRIRQG